MFDGGCRPAEFVRIVAEAVGWPDTPAATYKLLLFAVCLAAPLAFALAGWGAGLSGEACVAAAVLGCGVWWGTPTQTLFHDGAIDLLVAGLAAFAFVLGLTRYTAEPSPSIWCALAALSLIGWHAQPLVWLALLPVTLGHAFVVAPAARPRLEPWPARVAAGRDSAEPWLAHPRRTLLVAPLRGVP